MMKIRMRVIRVLAAVVACTTVLCVSAQTAVSPAPAGQPQTVPGGQLTAEQLDQLLAPIALYPDTLLAQILMASTYPLEVVQADRWLKDPNHAALTGDALNAALREQPWDPSVKSLVPFPQILRMMDDNLSWTEQLGDAFLANRPAVMDSVQRLRVKAQAAGALRTTPYQTVSSQDSVIVVTSPSPSIVYVPVYDPFVVYGPWPYPAYPPFFFPGYFSLVVAGGPGFGWFGFNIVIPLWGWSGWEWHRHRIHIDRDRFNEINFHHRPLDANEWRHDPEHRHGIPYRYGWPGEHVPPGARPPEMRREFRGYPGGEPVPPRQGIVQPLPQVVRPLPGGTQPHPPGREPELRGGEPRREGGQPEVGQPRPRGTQPQPPVIQPQPQVIQPQPQVIRTQPQVIRPQPQVIRPQPQVIQPAPLRGAAPGSLSSQRFERSPPAFESFGRGADVRAQSERGFASRHSAPMPPGGGAAGRSPNVQMRRH